MSRSTKQSLTMLACVGGCFIELSIRHPGDDRYKDLYHKATTTLRQWPQSGNLKNNVEVALLNTEQWRSLLDDRSEYFSDLLLMVASQLISDMLKKISNREKKELLVKLQNDFNMVYLVTAFRESTYEKAFEEYKKVVEMLYDIIGWN